MLWQLNYPRLSVTLLQALGYVACFAPPATGQEVERRTLAGERVVIHNLVGDLRIGPGPGPNIVVEVTRGGKDSGELRIESGDLEGRETLRVIYPEDEIVYPRLGRNSEVTLRVRDDGTLWGDHRRARRVTIHGRGPGLEAYADLRVQVPAGKKVAVHLGVGQMTAADVDGEIEFDGSSGDAATQNTRGLLSVDVGSGNITIRGAQGRLNVETGSGDVDASDIRGAEINIETGSGNISLNGVAAEATSIETGSGDVDLTGVTATRMDLETGSGNIRLGLRSDVQFLDVETSSGDVVVTVPPALGGQLEIETSSGEIETTIPITLRSKSEFHLIGHLGDGQGSIRIETGSGNVRLGAEKTQGAQPRPEASHLPDRPRGPRLWPSRLMPYVGAGCFRSPSRGAAPAPPCRWSRIPASARTSL